MDIISYSIAKKALKEAKKRGSSIHNVNTKNDLSTITNPVAQDMAIVMMDEDWNDNTSFYYRNTSSWLYIGTFGVGGTVFAFNVKAFDGVVSPGAEEIKFNWINPDDSLFIRRILFISETDITTMNYNDITTAGHVPVSDGVGTGINTADTFTFVATPDVTYYTKIFTEFDTPENRFSTGISKIVEVVDRTPPGNITNFTAIQNKDTITLTFTPPNDTDLGGIEIRMSDTQTPVSRFDGTSVFNQNGSTVTITNLDKTKKYYFRAFPYDMYPIPNYNTNLAQIVELQMDSMPPGEVPLVTKEEGHHYIGLTYNDPADIDWTKTIIVQTSGSPATSVADGIIVNTSTILNEYETNPLYITGLNNDEIYYFTFFTVDANDNVSVGVNIEATPVEKILDNVSNVVSSVNDVNSGIELTWINPIDSTFTGVEIVTSTTVNLEGMSLDDSNANASVTNLGIYTDISFIHPNLTLGDTYQYRLFAKYEIAGIVYSSSGVSISQLMAPSSYTGVISNFNMNSTSSSFSMTWDDPIDADYSETKVVYKIGSFPTNPSDGINLGSFTQNVHSVTPISVNGLTVDSHVYIQFFIYDIYGNMSSGVNNQKDFILYGVYGFDMNTETRSLDAVGKTRDSFDTLTPWSLLRRCVVQDNGSISYYLDELNSSQKENLSLAKLDGTDGQVMVEIPEFYYKMDGINAAISMGPIVGFTKFNKTYIGAFEGYLNGAKLDSKINSIPTVDLTLSQFRTYSENRGTDWGIMDIHTLSAIRTLFMIEYGSLNSQLSIGNGIVNDTGINETGKTVSLGNGSGVGLNDAISYRGIENIWGNIFEYVDGIAITDTGYYIATSNYGSFAGDASPGTYSRLGTIIPSNTTGFISELESEPYFIGKTMTGNDTSFVADYQYSHESSKVNALVSGGHYAYGSKAGLFSNHLGCDLFTTYDMTYVQDQDTGKIYEYTIQNDEFQRFDNINVVDTATVPQVQEQSSYPLVGARLIKRTV